MLRIFAGIGCTLLLLSAPLAAELALPVAIAEHLAPLSGTIILPVADEYLIDIDAAANLRSGDILTLIIPGESVRHPLTGEVLGTLDRPAGYLEITRIESGYAHARPLFADTVPQKGNRVRRFDRVPSRFIDKQDSGPELYPELKHRLPHLKWLSPGSSEEPLLIFVLQGRTLTVANAANRLLHRYQLADGPSAPAAKLRSKIARNEPEEQEQTKENRGAVRKPAKKTNKN